MTIEKKSLEDLSRIGGALGLDFVNTVDWRGREQSIDYLSDYRGLLGWWVFTGLVGPKEAGRMAAKAARNPGEAEKAAAEAVRSREALYRVFLALSQGGQAPQEDLALINLRLPGSFSGTRLRTGRDGISAGYEDRDKSLDWPLKAVVRSAVEVLTTVSPERIKTCRNRECGWVFWDKSKNRSRRWCDMSDCGNRAKAGRFYRKNRSSTQPC